MQPGWRHAHILKVEPGTHLLLVLPPLPNSDLAGPNQEPWRVLTKAIRTDPGWVRSSDGENYPSFLRGC